MTPWGLVHCKVFGPRGSSLKNRVREIFTHGSVGGVGNDPGPYPAARGAIEHYRQLQEQSEELSQINAELLRREENLGHG